MAKSKNPLLSMDAAGALASTLSFQRTPGATIIRKSPSKPYQRTLAQAYQRWLYQDYAYLWHSLSQAEKANYDRLARPLHMPGFALWMRERLSNLPDIGGMWYCDYLIGGSVTDFSRNSNTASVFQATISPGKISNCLSFDGIDDYASAPNHPSLNPTTAITVEAFTYFQPPHDTNVRNVVDTARNITGYSLSRTGLGYYFNVYKDWALIASAGWPHAQADVGVWQHIAATYQSGQIAIYINGTKENQRPCAELPASTLDFCIGARTLVHNFNWKGRIDHVIVYNRALSQAEIARHAQRSYP